MLRIWGWSLWAVVPVLAMVFHFGPGQSLMKRDTAVDRLAIAERAEEVAEELQSAAHEAQLATLQARDKNERDGTDITRAELDRLLALEQKAYAAASDAWKEAADRYHEVEMLLEGSKTANQIRWLRGRALVRAGEVFNGIDELQATLDEALSDPTSKDASGKASSLVQATREELAAANYYGARLLREEGRSADIWRQVSDTSRQQFRYLAEGASKLSQAEAAQSLQRNLERVLDLEQQDRSELVGKPIPKDSPRARRPGDGEPKRGRPGVGPPRGDQPANGASGMMEIGAGW
jgi:hypothetical protein